MKMCDKCLENAWGDFKSIEGVSTAICKVCGNEVSWVKKKLPKWVKKKIQDRYGKKPKR